MTAAIAPILPETIALAADILSDGGLIAMPTETVYGLAADAASIP
jgi:L-threonylcarbamoyladenylate synthase